jgi:hypothetical protein
LLCADCSAKKCCNLLHSEPFRDRFVEQLREPLTNELLAEEWIRPKELIQDVAWNLCSAPCRTSSAEQEAGRIAKAQRVKVRVRERIDPAREPNRIALNVSARLRIVVAEVVVVEPRLGVEVLARQYSDRPLPERDLWECGDGGRSKNPRGSLECRLIFDGRNLLDLVTRRSFTQRDSLKKVRLA